MSARTVEAELLTERLGVTGADAPSVPAEGAAEATEGGPGPAAASEGREVFAGIPTSGPAARTKGTLGRGGGGAAQALGTMWTGRGS
jgi:hypothetical protein